MKKLPIESFLDLLASGQPTPGGGSTAALVGAMGAALVSMVARLTVGRDKYAKAQDEMTQLLEESEALREQLTEAMQQDIKVYGKVMTAYALPRQGAGKSTRDSAIQAALREATEAPLACMQLSLKVIPLARRAVEIGNASAIADAGVAAIVAHAALRGAALNVFTNCAALEDPDFCRNATDQASQLLAEGARLEAEVFARVREKTAAL